MTKEDKEAIIRRLEAMYGEAEDNETKEALFYATEALKEQRPHGEWIPCSERLPEKDGKYLVTMKGWASSKPMVTTSIFVNSTKEWYPSCIAWMPLPEPYKKEGEAE